MNRQEYQQRHQELQTLQKERENLQAKAEELYAEFEETASKETRVELLEVLKQQKEKESKCKELSQVEYQGQQVQLQEFVALKIIERQIGEAVSIETEKGRVTGIHVQSSELTELPDMKAFTELKILNVTDTPLYINSSDYFEQMRQLSNAFPNLEIVDEF
jgi:uncharacterized coiled-coil DUF342 family protein